jgi:hypothetical protein
MVMRGGIKPAGARTKQPTLEEPWAYHMLAHIGETEKRRKAHAGSNISFFPFFFLFPFPIILFSLLQNSILDLN